MLIVIFMGRDHKQGFGPDFCKIIFFKIVSCILTTELLRLKIYSEAWWSFWRSRSFCKSLRMPDAVQCSGADEIRLSTFPFLGVFVLGTRSVRVWILVGTTVVIHTPPPSSLLIQDPIRLFLGFKANWLYWLQGRIKFYKRCTLCRRTNSRESALDQTF